MIEYMLLIALIYGLALVIEKILNAKGSIIGKWLPVAGFLRRGGDYLTASGWGVGWLGYVIIPAATIEINMEEFKDVECNCPRCTEARQRDASNDRRGLLDVSAEQPAATQGPESGEDDDSDGTQ